MLMSYRLSAIGLFTSPGSRVSRLGHRPRLGRGLLVSVTDRARDSRLTATTQDTTDTWDAGGSPASAPLGADLPYRGCGPCRSLAGEPPASPESQSVSYSAFDFRLINWSALRTLRLLPHLTRILWNRLVVDKVNLLKTTKNTRNLEVSKKVVRKNRTLMLKRKINIALIYGFPANSILIAHP